VLKFPDDVEIRVYGLDEILADLYAEGRQANEETSEEIIIRLEAKNNYIPSSDRARREYAYVLLNEYRTYLRDRAERLSKNSKTK
jgi:hypothetical protein